MNAWPALSYSVMGRIGRAIPSSHPDSSDTLLNGNLSRELQSPECVPTANRWKFHCAEDFYGDQGWRQK